MSDAFRNATPLISIIIPVYNVEHYLDICLESVCNQTYNNLEIILINDGSTDHSLQICQKWCESDARIILVDQHNAGVSSARNNGLSVATGEYITFVDSDDTIEAECIERLYTAMIEYNADISQCFWRRPNTVYKELDCLPETFDTRLFNRHEAYEDFLTTNVLSSSVWGKLFKKCLFKQLSFPDMKTGEDSLMLLYLYKRINTIISIPYIGYIYTDNLSGLDATRKNDLNSIAVGEFAMSYAKEHDKSLMPLATTKTAVFLFDAYFEALKTGRDELTAELIAKLSRLTIKNIKGSMKHKALIIFLRTFPTVTKKALYKKFGSLSDECETNTEKE